MKTKYFIPLIASIVLGIALFFSFWVLGNKLKNLRETGLITVKGVAEANYKSDYAKWQISAENWGSNYQNALNSNKKMEQILFNFLKNEGFSENEIQKGNRTFSNHYDEYTDAHGNWKNKKNGIDCSISFVVTSKKIKQIQNAFIKAQELKTSFEAINVEEPNYFLENLERIKRNLIAKATKDAKLRAEEFAKNNNCTVGSMRSASQGVFNILSTSENEEQDAYGGYYNTLSFEKKARLVVTIQYAIEE